MLWSIIGMISGAMDFCFMLGCIITAVVMWRILR